MFNKKFDNIYHNYVRLDYQRKMSNIWLRHFLTVAKSVNPVDTTGNMIILTGIVTVEIRMRRSEQNRLNIGVANVITMRGLSNPGITGVMKWTILMTGMYGRGGFYTVGTSLISLIAEYMDYFDIPAVS